MILLSLLLALQQQDLEKKPGPRIESEPRYNSEDRYKFAIGPDLSFWSARFSGQVREDSSGSSGSTIDLAKDLGLAHDRGIPIYGGGSLYVPLGYDGPEASEVVLSAEYFGRSWNGSTTLAQDQTLGGQLFPAGTKVDSHFRLASLDLAAGARITSLESQIRGGVSVLLHVTDGTLRITGAGAQKEAFVGDLTWGLALYGEYHPFEIGILGCSLKGYTNFGDDFTTWAADLRAYVGAEWKFFRLEIGYRYMPFSDMMPAEETFRFDLYGPYVSLSLWLRF